MANTEYNSLIQIQDEKGNVETHYPITKVENILGLENYTGKEGAALKLLAANSFIIDDETGITYKIGSRNGRFYFEESDVSVLDILNTVTEAVAEVANS